MPKQWIVDNDIYQIYSIGEGLLSDGELLSVLKRVNTAVGLCEIGKIANAMFWKPDSSTRSRSTLFQGEQILFSQWAMAYLAAGLVRAGGNDYRRRIFAKPGQPLDNLIVLNNTHHNCLVQPELLPGHEMKTPGDLDSFFLRTIFEQLPYQLDPVSEMARSIHLFKELSEQVQTPEIPNLQQLFTDITGLTLDDYFDISFAISAMTQERPVFSPLLLSQTPVVTLQKTLSMENLEKYLCLMAVDYSVFRENDYRGNRELPQEYTRFRFNPLVRTPIVISQKEKLHIVPNASLFIRASFSGLFWLFDSHFYALGKITEFRQYFSKIYEIYVGNILKDIYGDIVKHGGDLKTNYEFFDWYFDYDGTCYLFEVKAYQYPYEIHTKALPEDVEADVTRKIGGLIDQVARKMRDVNTLPFLKDFQTKQLCPVAVMWNMPLISTSRFSEKITQMIAEAKAKYSLETLDIHIMENHELENLVSVGRPIPLNEIFEEADRETNESIGSIINRRYKPTRNPTLQKIFTEFTDRISPAIADKSLR